jgi:proteic killer suppression protein
MCRVVLTDNARNDLKKLPKHIFRKFEFWVKQITIDGIQKVRKIPGLHDEPLKGDRQGQRSVRLSRTYRAIYRMLRDNELELVQVEEINKHEY